LLRWIAAKPVIASSTAGAWATERTDRAARAAVVAATGSEYERHDHHDALHAALGIAISRALATIKQDRQYLPAVDRAQTVQDSRVGVDARAARV
jgi:hypothetical protein